MEEHNRKEECKKLMNDICRKVVHKIRFPDNETQTEEFPVTAPLAEVLDQFRAEEKIRKEKKRIEDEERRKKEEEEEEKGKALLATKR